MTEDELGQDPKSPQDARLASLDERLATAQAKEAARSGRRRPWDVVPKGNDPGMRVLSVLIGYPLGSALIGWVIDRWVGTRWVMLVMLFLGFGAAGWEVWKISQAGRDSAPGKNERGRDR
jgi:ATP synthase protein I